VYASWIGSMNPRDVYPQQRTESIPRIHARGGPGGYNNESLSLKRL
jgi:hypothetical protein